MREGARTARALKPSGPRTQALATSIAAGGTVTTAQWNAAAQQDSVDAKRNEASRKRSAQAAAAKAAEGMTVDAILKQRFTPAEARRVPDAEGRKDKDHALVLAVDPERKFPRVLRGREWMLKDGESAEWLNRLQDALDREGARTPRQRAAVGNAIQARDAIHQAIAAAGDDRAAQATAVEKWRRTWLARARITRRLIPRFAARSRRFPTVLNSGCRMSATRRPATPFASTHTAPTRRA